MRRDSPAYLTDVKVACEGIAEFTRGLDFDGYLIDTRTRLAVERQFQIIGEALRLLRDSDPDVAAQIPELREIIGLRNVLVHGYATVDHETVWSTVVDDVPRLLGAVADRLRAAPEPGDAAPHHGP